MTKNNGEQFLAHCQDNNLEGVADCLYRGVDVNTVSEDGNWCGIYIAARWNYTKLLDILLGKTSEKVQFFFFIKSGL